MRKVKLGDICDFINGGAWSEKEFTTHGLPVLKVSNCKNSGFEIEEIDFLPLEAEEKYHVNRLSKGDVIIATVGSHPNLKESAAGRSSIVNSLVEGFYLNQNAVCLRTKDNNVLDQGYIGYLSKDCRFQHYIQMRGKGAANQMRIAIGAIKEYELDLPPIQEQKRVASVLSSYDDLIENNQKQIKLLEEVAQRLYKEWFVDLRFPRHKEVDIVDGVPEGWHNGKLSEIAEFKRGKTITKAQVEEGGIPVVAGGLEPAYYHNMANTSAPVITVSGSGANAGYSRLYYEAVFASDCSYTDINSTDFLYYVYCFLQANKFQLDALQKGSAQPHVYAKDINAMEILIPADSMIKAYCDKTAAMFESIGKLIKQNNTAVEARDRLLPKLMSGEIEL